MKNSRTLNRKKRHIRIRNKIKGTQFRPRLNIFKSNRHFYIQLIDDISRKTIISSSTYKMKNKLKSTSNILAAEKVGEDIAKKAINKNINNIVFDRSGYLYHGKIKTIADIIRKFGLKF